VKGSGLSVKGIPDELSLAQPTAHTDPYTSAHHPCRTLTARVHPPRTWHEVYRTRHR